MTIDAAGFLRRMQILSGDALDLIARCLKRLCNSRDFQSANQFGVTIHEVPHGT